MYLWMTDYVANTASAVYQKAGILSFTISDDMVCCVVIAQRREKWEKIEGEGRGREEERGEGKRKRGEKEGRIERERQRERERDMMS